MRLGATHQGPGGAGGKGPGPSLRRNGAGGLVWMAPMVTVGVEPNPASVCGPGRAKGTWTSSPDGNGVGGAWGVGPQSSRRSW